MTITSKLSIYFYLDWQLTFILLSTTIRLQKKYRIASKNLWKSQGYADNAGKNQATGARVVNTVGNGGTNQPRVVRCYNCNGEGHIAKQCIAKKRVKDAEWFQDKMVLAQAQEAGVVLNDEQQDFLADILEENDDCEDLQLQATTNFKLDHVDAYDLNYDDEATTNAIFMENLSPIGSFNDDTVEPRYDSDILSEVPHYDTYHESDMLNSNIQEMGYIENIVSHNESYDELTSNSNVISYTDYMVTIGNDADNYVPPPVQKNDMILSVIEQMKSQVEKCNTVNQETQSVNESLTSELERYKERVKTLENASK
ncbi:integrase, catalytic region, zinc finger, CCHC-type containing protein, partial [Tanacetum coccineum]